MYILTNYAIITHSPSTNRLRESFHVTCCVGGVVFIFVYIWIYLWGHFKGHLWPVKYQKSRSISEAKIKMIPTNQNEDFQIVNCSLNDCLSCAIKWQRVTINQSNDFNWSESGRIFSSWFETKNKKSRTERNQVELLFELINKFFTLYSNKWSFF